ncbi:MAG: sodium:solute symporter family protein [Pseudomonadota bacterium]
MNAYAIGILISLAIYILVGTYIGRRIKNLDDYVVAGRNAPTLLIVGTLVASTVSTGSFIGDTGFVYEGYTTSQIFGFVPIAILGFTFGGIFFGRYLRRSRAYTLAEFFGERFNSRRVRYVAALTVTVGLGAYLLAVNQGIAVVIEGVADVSYTTALIAAWLGYTAFTIYGGSRGVIITDTLMFLLFTIIAFFGLSYIVDAPGGWFATMQGLASFDPQPEIISAAGRSGGDSPWATSLDLWVWAIILGVSWGIAYSISPWQSSRYLMARDEHVSIRSACVAACVMAITWPVVYFSGAAVALTNPDIIAPDNPIVWAAMNIMPVVVGAVLLAGVVAAGLSSASTFLSLVGFAVCNDLIGYKSGDQKQMVRMSRIAMLGIGIAVLLVALNIPPAVFWITQFAGPMFAACWGPIAFMSIWSKRVTEPAAFWGMLSGLVGVLVFKAIEIAGVYDFPAVLDPILMATVLSLVTIVSVSSRTRVTAAEAEYRDKLHQAPMELSDADAARRTLIWPKVMMGFGVLMTVLMLVFYVRPYQVGAGIIERSYPFVAWSGETLLALMFGGIILTGGWIANRSVRYFLATGK